MAKLYGWFCVVALALAGVSLIAEAGPQLAARVKVYPATAALGASHDFAVRVRVPGGSWEAVPVFAVPVSTGIDVDADVRAGTAQNLGRTRSAMTSLASFDFSGAVEVEVTPLHRAPGNVRVRPAKENVQPVLVGQTIHFTLTRPGNLSLEIDGDIFHNLQLFAGELAAAPEPPSAYTLYYGPGIHLVGTVALQSGARVYLAGGAMVVGGFSVTHAHDVQIEGRGILASPRVVLPAALQNRALEAPANASAAQRRHDALLIEYSSRVKVAGLTLLSGGYTVLIGQSEDVEIRDLKSLSAGGNNDGIDVFSSQHVHIEGAFLRNSDDNIALYGHRWNYLGDLTDVTVQNSTLWADVAHPILVGTHGDSEHPETLSHLRFNNIDILDQREPQLDYQGCMSLNAGDGNLIRDVRFEDIRVDDFRMGQLLNLRVMFNRKYNTSPGRGIEDVVFRNVSYTGAHANPSMIMGYDDQRSIQRVRFEGLTINGVPISDTMKGKPGFYKTGDVAHIFIGEHVADVQFTALP